VYTLFFRVREICVRLRNLNEETMYAASLAAGWVANRAIFSTVLAAAALIVAMVFSGLLAERIVRPVRGFMAASRKISEGDYTVEVPVETTDELGRLAGEFNRMSAQLAQYHEINIEQIIAEKDKGEAILSSIEDGLVVFDSSLRVTALNPAARRILNTGLVDPSAQVCAEVVPAQSVCDLIRRTVDAGRPPDLPDQERIVAFSEGEGASHYLFSITVIPRQPEPPVVGGRAAAPGRHPSQGGGAIKERIRDGRLSRTAHPAHQHGHECRSSPGKHGAEPCRRRPGTPSARP
jgi:two-component system, NtrC family, sensor histidine kinase KinB